MDFYHLAGSMLAGVEYESSPEKFNGQWSGYGSQRFA